MEEREKFFRILRYIGIFYLILLVIGLVMYVLTHLGYLK